MNKSETRFGILDVLHFIGLLIIGLPLFYGLTFLAKGNIIISSTLSIVLVVALFALVIPLINQKSRYKNKPGIGELIVLFIYFMIAIIAAIPVSHFINTEIHLKQEIILNGQNKISRYKAMFVDADNEITNFGILVDSELNLAATGILTPAEYMKIISKYSAQTNLSSMSKKLRDRTIGDIKSNEEAFLKGKLTPVKNAGNAFANNSEKVFTNWQRLEIVRANYTLNMRFEKDYDSLKVFFRSKDIPFAYNIPNASNDINIESFSATFNASKGGGLFVSLSYLMLAHFLILANYLFSKRETEAGPRVNKEDDDSLSRRR